MLELRLSDPPCHQGAVVVVIVVALALTTGYVGNEFSGRRLAFCSQKEIVHCNLRDRILWLRVSPPEMRSASSPAAPALLAPCAIWDVRRLMGFHHFLRRHTGRSSHSRLFRPVPRHHGSPWWLDLCSSCLVSRGRARSASQNLSSRKATSRHERALDMNGRGS